MPTSCSLRFVGALLLGLIASGCGATNAGANTTTCAATDIVILPGPPPRGIAGSCGGTAGFTSAGKAPTVAVHVGEVIQLTHFLMRPLSTDPKVARVDLDRTVSSGNGPVWTLTLLEPGATTLYDRSVGFCMHGGTAPKCALANFRATQ